MSIDENCKSFLTLCCAFNSYARYRDEIPVFLIFYMVVNRFLMILDRGHVPLLTSEGKIKEGGPNSKGGR